MEIYSKNNDLELLNEDLPNMIMMTQDKPMNSICSNLKSTSHKKPRSRSKSFRRSSVSSKKPKRSSRKLSLNASAPKLSSRRDSVLQSLNNNFNFTLSRPKSKSHTKLPSTLGRTRNSISTIRSKSKSKKRLSKSKKRSDSKTKKAKKKESKMKTIRA